MRAVITPHVFSGTVRVPPSKSHTIRRLFMAALTDGVSRIENPLDSLDGRSCAAACRVLGAEITEAYSGGTLAAYTIRGHKPGGRGAARARPPGAPLTIDAGNSGTTLFFGLAAAALGSVPVTFSGDEQTARRDAAPLLDALCSLGAAVESNNGHTPITVCGPWKGGRASVSCPTSQYLSALLLAAPLAPPRTVTELDVPLLNEKPYVEMTLAYLNEQGLSVTSRLTAAPDFSRFRISGGAAYTPVNGPVPGDFSSAAFPAAAAAVSGGKVTLIGLDPADTQGDKRIFDFLARMGCVVSPDPRADGLQVTVWREGPLRGGVFDLNAAPDLLPVMAVLGAYAEGTTELVNASHARIKETDRIAVMAEELGKLGVRCAQEPGGLVIHGGFRPGGTAAAGSVALDGRGDHRVVMALACAALGTEKPVTISGAEAADVTYPGFLDLLKVTAV
jgi:3-phosphoshikimate 1-carboxyvinyltransferase